MRRGRPILRWEACKEIREDSRREGSWKKKKRDRGGWKRLSDDAVEKLRRARQTPCQREKILCMNYTEVCVPIGCTTVLGVDRDR